MLFRSACVFAISANASLAQDKPPLKLGGILDMSSLYADITGSGSETAAKMAAEDFGGAVLGRKIEIVVGDHLNKADLSANIARDMIDNQGVEMIFDVAASATALAAAEIAKARGKIIMFNGPGSIRLSNEACGPYTVHYVFDTFAQANVTGLAAVKSGLDTWFFLTADYAFGYSLEENTTKTVDAKGGKVLGTVRFPIGATDYSAFLLQAQASGAKVVGLASAGMDTQNQIKQAAEFGITAGGQNLAGLLLMITDVHGLGLQAAQGLYLTESYYWDRNDASRAFAQKYKERTGAMPSMVQAATYSAARQYLKAVEAAGTDETEAVAAKLHEMPVQDAFAENGKVQANGRMVSDVYLMQVKTPAESTGEWDLAKIISTTPGDVAYLPAAESGCPLVK